MQKEDFLKKGQIEKVFFYVNEVRWLRTSDVAKMDENSCFYIVDRLNDIIKYKGHSVYPREVEDVVYEHPAIQEICVVGVPDPEAGETIKAYFVLRPEYKEEDHRVRHHRVARAEASYLQIPQDHRV